MEMVARAAEPGPSALYKAAMHTVLGDRRAARGAAMPLGLLVAALPRTPLQRRRASAASPRVRRVAVPAAPGWASARSEPTTAGSRGGAFLRQLNSLAW